MNEVAGLGLGGAGGLLRLAVGGLLLLAPGLAAVDRLVGLRRNGWMLAPVFSFTLMPLGAIVLDVLFHVPVRPASTAALAVAWTLLFLSPRLLALARPGRRARTPPGPGSLPWRAWRPTPRGLARGAALCAVLALVALMAAVPHLPGEDPAPLRPPEVSAWEALPMLVQRGVSAFGPGDLPFPIHVDEHYHLAQQAQVLRQGRIDIDDPYTGLPPSTSLFSIAGFRGERGFDVAMVQSHHLTGLPLATQERFFPALQAAVTAGVLYALLAPAPGAMASALFVGAIPTTVRFLGPGFLVPSAFALPWVLAAAHVSLRGSSGRRLGALALVETGAFFLHLVLGVLALAAAALATLARPGRLGDRAALLVAALLPLLWIGPLVWADATAAVRSTHELPFSPEVVFTVGWPLLALAAAGAALAFLARPPAGDPRPHQTLAALAGLLAVAMALSLHFGHRNDATYSRLLPTFLLCLAALAGLAAGWAGHWAARAARSMHPERRMALAAGVTAALAVACLAPAAASHLETQYYRVFDAGSWQDADLLADADPLPGERFLSHPWQAPAYAAASGALPVNVLIPSGTYSGGRQAEWTHYLSTGGASQEWFDDRRIDYVVGPGPPKADHDHLGGRVYRIIHHGPE